MTSSRDDWGARGRAGPNTSLNREVRPLPTYDRSPHRRTSSQLSRRSDRASSQSGRRGDEGARDSRNWPFQNQPGRARDQFDSQSIVSDQSYVSGQSHAQNDDVSPVSDGRHSRTSSVLPSQRLAKEPVYEQKELPSRPRQRAKVFARTFGDPFRRFKDKPEVQHSTQPKTQHSTRAKMLTGRIRDLQPRIQRQRQRQDQPSLTQFMKLFAGRLKELSDDDRIVYPRDLNISYKVYKDRMAKIGFTVSETTHWHGAKTIKIRDDGKRSASACLKKLESFLTGDNPSYGKYEQNCLVLNGILPFQLAFLQAYRDYYHDEQLDRFYPPYQGDTRKPFELSPESFKMLTFAREIDDDTKVQWHKTANASRPGKRSSPKIQAEVGKMYAIYGPPAASVFRPGSDLNFIYALCVQGGRDPKFRTFKSTTLGDRKEETSAYATDGASRYRTYADRGLTYMEGTSTYSELAQMLLEAYKKPLTNIDLLEMSQQSNLDRDDRNNKNPKSDHYQASDMANRFGISNAMVRKEIKKHSGSRRAWREAMREAKRVEAMTKGRNLPLFAHPLQRRCEPQVRASRVWGRRNMGICETIRLKAPGEPLL